MFRNHDVVWYAGDPAGDEPALLLAILIWGFLLIIIVSYTPKP